MEWSWVDAEDVRGLGGDVLRRVGCCCMLGGGKMIVYSLIAGGWW